MIEVSGIYKSFGNFQALRGVSFSLKKGEVVGFLGPNGAGKTTTMRILTGFIPPTEGVCRVAEFDLATHKKLAQKKMGYLPEATPLYTEMEVVKFLNYVGSLRGMNKKQLSANIKDVVHTCGLTKVVGRKIAELSKGYRQRVGLAQVLLHEPEILILDEPTVGLDPNQIVEIRELIRHIGRDRTVLLSTHILSEVEQVCERVIIINEGKIVGQGTPAELVTKAQGGEVYLLTLKINELSRDGMPLAQYAPPLLGSLNGFEKMTVIAQKENEITIEASFGSSQDRREELFKLAVASGWVLLELSRVKLSLEDVFKKLTR
ncbi:MAG TPA: hypothetical protein DDW49_00405 [Deltaproteobacteria bacterium]|nr:MAG: hypothetical protein A2048_10490 [Deltaproteobacteria bacterium GWA2_45_12]HBF11847.1 hypothetical protein [Deltaproteobacteria bacterium]